MNIGIELTIWCDQQEDRGFSVALLRAYCEALKYFTMTPEPTRYEGYVYDDGNGYDYVNGHGSGTHSSTSGGGYGKGGSGTTSGGGYGMGGSGTISGDGNGTMTGDASGDYAHYRAGNGYGSGQDSNGTGDGGLKDGWR
jgi:hypothetical protein